MTQNLVKTINKYTDTNQLIEIISEVIGENCWKVNLSYGDELILHIGARIPYITKSMIGKEKGAWILGTQATQWRLDSLHETIVFSDNDSEIIREKINIIKDCIITMIEFNHQNLGLIVTFNNECKLILSPNIVDVDLPYWEMFTPDQMILKVGPGATWSYINANTTNQ